MGRAKASVFEIISLECEHSTIQAIDIGSRYRSAVNEPLYKIDFRFAHFAFLYMKLKANFLPCHCTKATSIVGSRVYIILEARLVLIKGQNVICAKI